MFFLLFLLFCFVAAVVFSLRDSCRSSCFFIVFLLSLLLFCSRCWCQSAVIVGVAFDAVVPAAAARAGVLVLFVVLVVFFFFFLSGL